MLLSVLLLLLQLLSDAHSSHYRGTMVTYYPMETSSDGSISVILRFKFNFYSCEDHTFVCTGNCGKESIILSNAKLEEVTGSWCQSETISTRQLFDNSPFRLEFTGGNWLDNYHKIVSWKAVADVELRTRSDTNRPNSSPQTTIFPVLRVPSNCQRNISLLAFDPDGDEVRCRFASSALSECKDCTTPSVLSISSTCILSFRAASSSSSNWYAVQMVMEDFPRQPLTLTHTDGSKVVKTTNDPISMIPVQFAFQVDSDVSSCTYGVYLPKFVFPTPEHGARLYSPVNQTLEINIRAEANQSEINGVLCSGPYNVVKSKSGSGIFTLNWTPSAREAGQSHPVCFIAQANVSSSIYQSELRCVIVTVGNDPSPPPKTTHLTVLKLNISTSLSLRDKDGIEQAIKGNLVAGGLPADIKVRLRSVGRANRTAAP